MDWEKASFGVTIAVLALQAWNLYISASIKLWASERFVTKTDFLNTLSLWSDPPHSKGPK